MTEEKKVYSYFNYEVRGEKVLRWALNLWFAFFAIFICWIVCLIFKWNTAMTIFKWIAIVIGIAVFALEITGRVLLYYDKRKNDHS